MSNKIIPCLEQNNVNDHFKLRNTLGKINYKLKETESLDFGV